MIQGLKIGKSVLSARNILRGACSQYGGIKGSGEMFSSKEVSGLGLCVLSPEDLSKGIKSYTSLLKRYALHVSEVVLSITECISIVENTVGLPRALANLYGYQLGVLGWVIVIVNNRVDESNASMLMLKRIFIC